jgi:hypothetical protein
MEQLSFHKSRRPRKPVASGHLVPGVPHVGFDEFNLCQIFEHLLIASLGGNG